MDLVTRCRKIWKEEFHIEDEKIEWLIKQLTQEAKDNSDKISDEQIRNAKNRLLWYGLAEALTNYVQWESAQN